MIVERQKAIPALTIPAVAMRYGNILSCDRPSHDDDLFGRRHPRMSQQHRAKIFAPFAALEGFEGHIQSKEIPYVSRHILDADEAYALNRDLFTLYQLTRTGPLARKNRVTVSGEYFEPCTDENHDACGTKGLYRTATDIVKCVDPVSETLRIGNRVIPFSDIYRITDPAGRLPRQGF